MSQVAINKCKDIETTPKTLLEKVEAVAGSIRERAFELFQHRGAGNGSELEDWLQAERDLVWLPASELADDEKEFTARIAVPGFDGKDIHVSAMPDALVIQADTAHTHEGKTGNVCFCEFSGKQLYRRLDLPASIDVDKVKASVNNGILEITAPKAATSRKAAAA
jgi:HSP20 family molecular chaperone IbpA